MKHITACIIRNLSILYSCIYVSIIIICFLTSVCGWSKYVVTSGSMAPEISVGSCIWIKKTKPELLKEKDIISFTLPENDIVVTHRIILHDMKNRIIRTQGDANQLPDAAFVLYDNILGKVVFHVPYLGYVLLFLSDSFGKIVSVGVFVLCSGLLRKTVANDSHQREFLEHSV